MVLDAGASMTLLYAGMGDSLPVGTVCNQPSQPTQPPILSGTENEYQPKCGDAVWLGSKAGWLIAFVNERVGGRCDS